MRGDNPETVQALHQGIRQGGAIYHNKILPRAVAVVMDGSGKQFLVHAFVFLCASAR